MNTPTDGDATTSLGNPFQCLTALSEKKCLLISNLNLLWLNLRPRKDGKGKEGGGKDDPLDYCLQKVLVESLT